MFNSGNPVFLREDLLIQVHQIEYSAIRMLDSCQEMWRQPGGRGPVLDDMGQGGHGRQRRRGQGPLGGFLGAMGSGFDRLGVHDQKKRGLRTNMLQRGSKTATF